MPSVARLAKVYPGQIGIGTSLVSVFPSPREPSGTRLSATVPQHQAVPSVCSPQTSAVPAEMEAQSESEPTWTGTSLELEK